VLGSFRAGVRAARRHESLYFAALLPEERILQAFGSARLLWQGWAYTPAVTVWVFLSQCLSMDHSCREAVARLGLSNRTRPSSLLLDRLLAPRRQGKFLTLECSRRR